MNEIFLEDCIKTLTQRKISYDYVFCVPPDFDELGLSPNEDKSKYEGFLYTIFELFSPKRNTVTIAITDRKYDSGITTKHMVIIDIMRQLDYKYISQKIWCKSYKLNLYRLNYSFVMSFAKKPYKQNHDKRFEEDVWNNHAYAHKSFRYAIALEVVKRCIMNFTNEGEVVYDPFSGSATTAIACLETKRDYLGSEISPEFYGIGNDRIAHYAENKERENKQMDFLR